MTITDRGHIGVCNFKRAPKLFEKGQLSTLFGGKEGQFYSQYEATLCSFKECEIESLATD